MKPIRVGDTAIAKRGYHGFEVGTVMRFVGMCYEYGAELYLFTDGKTKEELSEDEFTWSEEGV